MSPVRYASLLFTVLFTVLPAQFSPGKLSKYHADLEGTSNCIQCHELRKKELSDGCVVCHTPLKERIDQNRGYHADKKSNCGECHSDHNGRAFELVYWPKDIGTFDHNKTGYTLTGGHQKPKCNECHKRDFIRDASVIAWAEKYTRFPVLDRTFLGLSRTCNACHIDVHRGEVSAECTTCHTTESWQKAADVFDHQKARFSLTGAHKKVTCEKCHKIDGTRTPPVKQLTGLAFNSCLNCHKDQHNGTYGNKCETCHTTKDWKKDLIPFDHSKTKYPLVGKHTNVKCIQCHKPALKQLPRYLSCTACHEDRHYGQFAQRKDGGDCGVCHTVQGFKPTTFTIAQHQETRFVLDGGHLAIPCIQCHKPFQPQAGVTTTRFTWKENRCETCHQDVHRNQFITHYQNACQACHITQSFNTLVLDHQQTAFPLDGKHRNVACGKCHETEEDVAGVYARYYPVAHRCEDCHTLTRDIR
ncbi:MAG: cytochrome C [Fidelibacterota bacterium]